MTMNEMFFSPSDWQSIAFRLTLALVVGMAVISYGNPVELL
ncbi:hypothetical protein [Iningainema tapete]|nr:hypothetical protein [Iningainema tapete]